MSWKKYGGIKQLTQSNYVNVNSVVTNTLTLREHYDGNFQINGSLFVNPEEGATNSSVNGNLDVSGNLLVTGNVTLEGDIRPNNIYVNNILDVSGVTTLKDKVFLDSSESTFLSGSLGKIGVNRLEADYLWDVCANHTQVARFVSHTDSAQHVIIQNKHHYGIVSEVDNSANRLLFYHQDVSMTEGEFGGVGGVGGVASIQYTPDGIMTHDVSQSIVLQTQQVIVGVDGVDGVDGVGGEATLTVYDSLVDGSSTYLSHVDLSNTTTTSTALQLVSHNNSSNTFLKMVTPQNKGWNYGGGLYPFDTSRSMGSLGWTDICGSHYVFSDSRYIPSQTMVAGNNVSFLRSSTGFNTFQPETDRYTVNINGPLKLQHQEIHEVANMPFILRQIAMSKYDGYGLAVGEKYESDSGGNSHFYYFLTSYDYGRTWSSMDVTSTNDITFDAVVADSSFALIYGEEQNTFYSVGSSGILNYSGSSGSDTDIGVSKRFLFRYNNSYRMFVFENSEGFDVTNSSDNGNHYYSNVTLEGNNITVVQQINDGEEEGESNDLSYNAIYSIDGASNEDSAVAVDGYYVFYMAGRYGINGTIYQVLHNENGVSGKSLLYTSSSVGTGTGTEYVSIKSFGDNLVAIGGTYVTTGGGSASFSDYKLGVDFSLNDVFLLDASHAIVVGTNATLFYSRNYMQQEWSMITMDMIDGMGNGHVLLDSQNDLLSVHMIDANTFLFGCKFGSTGESKILSCHFPDLFYPETAPSVLDICGNVTFGGSLYGSSEVQLFSTSSVVQLGATDSRINMGVVNAQEILLQNEECLQLSTISDGADHYTDSGGTDVSLSKRIVLGDANTRIDIVGYLNLLDLSATNIEGGGGTDTSGSDISGSLDVNAVNDLIDSRLTTFYDVSISTIERTSSKYFYVNYDASYSDIQTAGAGLYIYNDISSINCSGESGLEDGYIRISKYKVAGESKQDSFSFLATGCDSNHGVRLNIAKIADNTTKLNDTLPTGSSRKPLMFTNYKNNDGNNAPTDAEYLDISGDFEDDRAEIVVDETYPYMDECGNLFTNGHHLYTVDLSLSGMLYGMDASFVSSVYMDTDLSVNGTGDIGTLVVHKKTTIGGSLHGADASFNGSVFIGVDNGVGTDTPKLAVEHLEISGGSVGRSVSLLYTDAIRGHQLSLGTDVVDFSNSVLFVGGIQDCGIVMGVSGDRPYIAATRDKSGLDASGLYLSTGPYDFSDNTTGMVVGKDSVQVNTGLSALSFSALSDYRLKHNVEEIELRDLDKMDLLRPVSYSMRGADERQYGFIAHELQTHYPDLVLGEKDANSMQQINYIGLIPLLVREIQDLRTKVAELSSRIG